MLYFRGSREEKDAFYVGVIGLGGGCYICYKHERSQDFWQLTIERLAGRVIMKPVNSLSALYAPSVK